MSKSNSQYLLRLYPGIRWDSSELIEDSSGVPDIWNISFEILRIKKELIIFWLNFNSEFWIRDKWTLKKTNRLKLEFLLFWEI